MALPAVYRSPTESIAMSEGYPSYPLVEYSTEDRCVDRRYRMGKKEAGAKTVSITEVQRWITLLGNGGEPVDGADGSVFLIALRQQERKREIIELRELVAEGFGDTIGDGIQIPMGPADRFWDDFVHDMEVDQIFCRHLQCGSGIGNFRRIVP